MYDAEGEIIYIGKAKNLKNRVSQYFQDTASHTLKTRLMVSNVADFQVIIVNSELEALLLENSLIKKHRPKYNILLKDDKGYPYIKLSAGDRYPKFSLANHQNDDGGEYFGPFGGRNATYEIIDALLTALKLPRCSREFPRDIGKYRPCLNYQLKLCSGYCRSGDMEKEYNESISVAADILRGKYKQMLSQVHSQMLQAADDMQFETAARLRDRYKALKTLENRQQVTGHAPVLDAAACAVSENKAVLCVLHYGSEGLSGKDLVFGANPLGESEEAVLSGLLRQYYQQGAIIPKTVCLFGAPEESVELSNALSALAEKNINVFTPQRGEKAAYTRLARENALQELMRVDQRRKKGPGELLKKALGLEHIPERIEAYDISNTAGQDTVGSMVVFKNGRPAKSQYRSFVLNSDYDGDDYGAMREVLARRFKRLGDGDKGFEERPDLVLIDGGATHAAAAREIIDAFDMALPVLGMVKDGHHRTRALVSADGEEIGIKNEQSLYTFIGRMQEEVHRFAITHHRKRRDSRVKRSELDGISGIGEKRKMALLAHFKSIKAITAADIETLSAVVPKNAAEAVYKYFHTGEMK